MFCSSGLPRSPLLFAVYHNFPEVVQSLSTDAKPELEFSLSQQKATVREGDVWRPGTLVLCKSTGLRYNQQRLYGQAREEPGLCLPPTALSFHRCVALRQLI